MSVHLCVSFLQRHWTDELRSPMERGHPFKVIKLLWPFVEAFSVGGPAHEATKLAYDPAYEPEVDAMMEQMAADPAGDSFTRTAEAARVLHERVTQSIIVLTANVAAGEMVLLPVDELPPRVRAAAVAILWLHEMELPFAPGTVLPPMPERH